MTASQRQNPSLVIFDCDGVLVDSERLIVDAEVRIFPQLGVHIGREEIIEQFVGTSGEDFRHRLDVTLGSGGYEAWNSLYQDWFRDDFYRNLEPVDGIHDALTSITQSRCVASNSSPERVRRSLEVTRLADFFGCNVFTAADVPRAKPAPDIFLHAARAMHTPPSHCVVIEDSRFGVQAARSAGMRVLAYAGGITHAKQLDGPNTTVFRRMQDLAALVAGSK